MREVTKFESNRGKIFDKREEAVRDDKIADIAKVIESCKTDRKTLGETSEVLAERIHKALFPST